jgi:hypothetical protein
MGKMMNLPEISCKKATELIDKETVTKLSLKERTQLQLHKAICSGCRAYEKQSILLDELLKQYLLVSKELVIPQKVNNTLKEQIIRKLK